MNTYKITYNVNANQTYKQIKKSWNVTSFKNFRISTMIGWSATPLSNIDAMDVFVPTIGSRLELAIEEVPIWFTPLHLCASCWKWILVPGGTLGIVYNQGLRSRCCNNILDHRWNCWIWLHLQLCWRLRFLMLSSNYHYALYHFLLECVWLHGHPPHLHLALQYMYEPIRISLIFLQVVRTSEDN